MDHLETLSDPHIIAREMIAKVHHPKAGSGRTLGTPIKLSKTPGGVRRAAPTLGEHNDEVRAQVKSNVKGNAE